MVFCIPVCQPHDLVSQKYLRSSTGHSFCLGQPHNLILFAYCSICRLLNHNPEISVSHKFLSATNFVHLRVPQNVTFWGVIFDYARVLANIFQNLAISVMHFETYFNAKVFPHF